MTSQRKTIVIIDLHLIRDQIHVLRNEAIVSGAEMVKITTSEVIVPTQQPEETIQRPYYEPQAPSKAHVPLKTIPEGSQLTFKEIKKMVYKRYFRSKMSLSFAHEVARVYAKLEQSEDGAELDFSMFKNNISEVK